MMFIDSHCHLEPEDFRAPDGGDDRPQVLARARAAGLSQLIVIGSGRGIAESENAIALASAHPQLFAAVGIHPHDASAVISGTPRAHGQAGPQRLLGEALFDEIARLARHPRAVCVGETGLDYHYNHSTPDEQQALLRRFCALARQVEKPLSLHIRDAHQDARRIVREGAGPQTGGVIHCFTGTPDDASAWLDLGFHISFSGIVTFKSATAIQEACKRVPDGRLLLETDCPYLTPAPFRGKRNEPAYLVHTAAFVARLRGVSEADLGAKSSAATRALFHLPAPAAD